MNGLRAIAAFSVVIFHLNMSMHYYSLPEMPTVDLAGFGVTIFFAISGFLITFLLLKEKEIKEINIKHFYLRRILRIWPLYFLILIVSLFTAYQYNIGELPGTLPYYVFILANVPFALGTALPFLGHYWSIGVEEQFYLFWPWLVKKKSNVLKTVTVFAISYFFLRVICRIIEIKFGYSYPYLFVHICRFDCMAIGGIGGILFFQKNATFLKIVQLKISQIIAWTVIVLLMFNKFHIASLIDNEIVSIITVVLIINLSQNKKTLINLEYPVFNFLGKISYGVYIIHQLVIFYCSKFINLIEFPYYIKLPIVYLVVIGVTILLSYLSYEYFEKLFLKIKQKYTTVQSFVTPKL